MKKIEYFFVVIIVLFCFASCAEEVEKVEKVVRPIKSQKVVYSTSDQVKTFPGTAEMDQVIDLSFRSGGIINQLNVRLGQKVRKGQLLAKLDNAQTQLAYEQAIAQKNSAESQLNTAKQGFDRTRLLFEKGSVSLSDFEASKNGFRMAEQNLELTKRSVAIQKEQIRFHFLYAPKNGLIAAVDSEINENVTPGQRIATLNVGKSMDIISGVPESVINAVQLGDTVKINFPSLPDTHHLGIISEIAPSLSANTGVFPVKAKLLKPTDLVKNGMTANVQFNFTSRSTSKRSLIIPTQAVGEDKEGQFVYLVVNDNGNTIVKKQPIVIGHLTPKGFEVRSGLLEGQEIAVAGLQSLWDGLEVKLKG